MLAFTHLAMQGHLGGQKLITCLFICITQHILNLLQHTKKDEMWWTPILLKIKYELIILPSAGLRAYRAACRQKDVDQLISCQDWMSNHQGHKPL